MSDISVTAANVRPYDDANLDVVTAGETIAAGKSVYIDNTRKAMLADADTEAQAFGIGVAMCGASRKQPLVVARSGHINPGAAVVIGTTYVISGTAGGICPIADLGSGDWVTILGMAIETDKLRLNIQKCEEPKT